MEVLLIARRVVAQESLRRRINEIVMDRGTKAIKRAVRLHGGVPDAERDEAENEALVRFGIAILEESTFEYRFNYYMKRLAQHVGEHIRRGDQGAHERAAIHGLPGIDYPEARAGADPQVMEDVMLVEEGLKALPALQARALRLHYLVGFPIFSSDPENPTVASILHYAERQTRQIMSDALAAFMRWDDEQGRDV